MSHRQRGRSLYAVLRLSRVAARSAKEHKHKLTTAVGRDCKQRRRSRNTARVHAKRCNVQLDEEEVLTDVPWL